MQSSAPGLYLPSVSLWRRDMVRFLRQRSRVIGALLTPVTYWLLMGFGLNRNFSVETGEGQSIGYLQYFFPGTLSLVVLFTAIFSTISVIEDRREGFLQGVLASPAPRLSIALGKVLAGATLATLQGALLLLLWLLVANQTLSADLLLRMAMSVGIIFLMGLGLTALGLCLAWPMDSVAGFHAVMNLVLMPMWLLSGSVFPIRTAPVPMQVIMYLNPLTYGQAALAGVLFEKDPQLLPLPLPVTLGISAGSAVLALALAARIISKPRKDGQ